MGQKKIKNNIAKIGKTITRKVQMILAFVAIEFLILTHV